jgi:hypothetical protein
VYVRSCDRPPVFCRIATLRRSGLARSPGTHLWPASRCGCALGHGSGLARRCCNRRREPDGTTQTHFSHTRPGSGLFSNPGRDLSPPGRHRPLPVSVGPRTRLPLKGHENDRSGLAVLDKMGLENPGKQAEATGYADHGGGFVPHMSIDPRPPIATWPRDGEAAHPAVRRAAPDGAEIDSIRTMEPSPRSTVGYMYLTLIGRHLHARYHLSRRPPRGRPLHPVALRPAVMAMAAKPASKTTAKSTPACRTKAQR